ncbi:transglutaminase-like domain-containing protein [Heyndrickxia oleronia]|jgi:hypothetical protein|uniref:transglutaminase-like domain-containing protein n=1 Tax=Heyndrickxia oleronia TaxID=38875 RepID=UPI00242BACFF|nr:transglutaminase-like domain-containing protein [Heyndrickxia oleronia]MCI1592259.1 transglutaminase-like domain-containing protein [Heyndrickxia oleronia]MCI1612003.1 transglutaminase-like domain-containing protein [Heyndrickxia oleronia]MCI1759712.1 transglutaminase-like domain-containing protein [Heyndrickxia oleronia]
MDVKKLLTIAALSLVLTSACSNGSKTQMSDKKETIKVSTENTDLAKYDKLVKEKNIELKLEPLELTNYKDKIGATLTNPKYKKFAVNKELTISGVIEKEAQLKERYAWVKVSSLDIIDSNSVQDYYIPIENGTFKEDIHFYNGKGNYSIRVMLPATDRNNYYYDLATFEVINLHPEKQRDVTYTPYAQDASLVLKNVDSGLIEASEHLNLQGKVKNLEKTTTIMIEVKKDMENWKHEIPVKNGQFSYDVPLFYGKGLHQINVLVPDKMKDNRYQYGTTLFVNNRSNKQMTPIEFYRTYDERGIQLETPRFGNAETKLTYQIKGKIDPDANLAKETTHIYIKTKKDQDEALDIIPVKDFTFDGSIYLRFGPGEYEVSVNVPEIREKNTNYFRYFSVASFSVTNLDKNDQRDLLPSRGIPSKHSKIIKLAKEITKDSKNDREKAKAIYDFTSKNISYDVQKFKNNEFEWDDNALKTLRLKTGVCQDYAYLAGALLRASNIEARVISGKAGTGILKNNHAWIEAKVNGKWLTMDPTWGAGYVQNNQFIAKYNEQYFDPNEQEFRKTHIRENIEY